MIGAAFLFDSSRKTSMYIVRSLILFVISVTASMPLNAPVKADIVTEKTRITAEKMNGKKAKFRSKKKSPQD